MSTSALLVLLFPLHSLLFSRLLAPPWYLLSLHSSQNLQALLEALPHPDSRHQLPTYLPACLPAYRPAS